jgi:large subunit ribosomal protein L18e
MKRTGPTNEYLKQAIVELREHGVKTKEKLWLRAAKDLSRSTRARRRVNLSRINRNTKKGDIVLVPGKVLSAGDLDHPVEIAAWQFSDAAKEKIKKAHGKVLSLKDVMKHKSRKVKLIG